jgi:DNA topoisomerase-3
MIMSQLSASSKPPPMRPPWTPAIVGIGSCSRRSSALAKISTRGRNFAAEMPGQSRTSPPPYPRAESRYLPESLIPDVPKIVAALTGGKVFGSLPMPPRPIIRRGKVGHFWDKGLESVSHHAIIPNVNTVGDLRSIWPRLSGDERRLFIVIARSYLAALMPDFRYRQTMALLDVHGHAFRAVGRQTIEIGWRAAFGEEDDNDGHDRGDNEDHQTLPPLRDGEKVGLSGPKVETKETKPPPRYNEGTLIEAMANAWRFVENPEHRERLKEAKGIGTPATQAEIIQGLKRQDLLTASGKHIVPTERGLVLYDVLGNADQALARLRGFDPLKGLF